MNKDNVLTVADGIDNSAVPDLGFNMNWWEIESDDNSARDMSGHNCGTIACIGGWTERLFPGVEASETLGLTGSQARALFYPDGHFDATPDKAVAVLRHLAETGEVDWSIATPATAA